ncbi:DNA translocase FtsK 4TM domain-containing protein [Candidatus Parabeggiatoa sp. HSG14]|uniref:DNA translocase FtsK n=1 Tax=Candidatus Parabeggiatoa sp. HSG14 TaxID=3055593 RepID=UPI0025A71E29|nr:DNA translocase FtsK 4TM domain-containing protein [Thiotrichales bacterium HSG14]
MPMTQARRGNRRIKSPNKNKKTIKHGLREIVLIFFCFVGLYLFVSLLTYYGSDPGWSHSGQVEEIRNKGGIVGALFADTFFHLFGYFAYLFPFMVGYTGWLIYQGRHHDILAEPRNLIVPGIGFVLTLSAGCGLAIVHFMAESALLPTHAGGILGMWVGNGLVSMVDRLGATLILLAIFFTGVTLLTGLSWLKLMDNLGYHTLLWLPVVKKYMSKQFWPWFLTHTKRGLQVVKNWLTILFHNLLQGLKTAYQRWQERRIEWHKERERYDMYDEYEEYEEYEEEKNFPKDNTPIRESNHHQAQSLPKTKETAIQIPIDHPEAVEKVSTLPLLPALSLLDPVPNIVPSPMVKMFPQQIVDAFATLQIEITINAVHPGPVLTGFEVHTITAINTKHLDELSKELAETLKVESVRIMENQQGVLDVEMPNFKRQTIYLSELLKSTEYQNHLSLLAVALGQDVSGQPVVIDLNRVPHILIAGNDISEKTMVINTLILALLYKSSPEALRFLLIESTSQALSVYANLPHLLTPIITDMSQVPSALLWCVQEMERRYQLMVSFGVRNIEDYNQALLNQDNKEVKENEEPNKPLFYIVVIINEIAELMASSMDIRAEQSITRLTQKARAAGIHIILATEHLTVNVITGLIKANIPTRMAFRVNNKSESRTILGQMGAENLLGKGDMLYMTAGTGMPVRVHGSFISENEVLKVVTDLKSCATPDYIDLTPND